MTTQAMSLDINADLFYRADKRKEAPNPWSEHLGRKYKYFIEMKKEIDTYFEEQAKTSTSIKSPERSRSRQTSFDSKKIELEPKRIEEIDELLKKQPSFPSFEHSPAETETLTQSLRRLDKTVHRNRLHNFNRELHRDPDLSFVLNLFKEIQDLLKCILSEQAEHDYDSERFQLCHRNMQLKLSHLHYSFDVDKQQKLVQMLQRLVTAMQNSTVLTASNDIKGEIQKHLKSHESISSHSKLKKKAGDKKRRVESTTLTTARDPETIEREAFYSEILARTKDVLDGFSRGEQCHFDEIFTITLRIKEHLKITGVKFHSAI